MYVIILLKLYLENKLINELHTFKLISLKLKKITTENLHETQLKKVLIMSIKFF